MNVRTIQRTLRGGQLPLLGAVLAIERPYYRLCFLGAAARCGLLSRLRMAPAAFEELARELVPDRAGHEALRA